MCFTHTYMGLGVRVWGGLILRSTNQIDGICLFLHHIFVLFGLLKSWINEVNFLGTFQDFHSVVGVFGCPAYCPGISVLKIPNCPNPCPIWCPRMPPPGILPNAVPHKYPIKNIGKIRDNTHKLPGKFKSIDNETMISYRWKRLILKDISPQS